MLNNLFISDAIAQTSEAANNAGEFSFSSFVPLILIFAIFYFLIIRPQTKKMKDHQNMLDALKIGNRVITSGGIVGVVKEILTKENQVEVEIADGTNVKIVRSYIAEVITTKNLPSSKSDKTKKSKATKKTK